MVRRRALYHCTHADCGDTLLVRRRMPRLRATGEPAVPRLCACPSVLQCFAARLFDPAPVHVYRIVARGVAPRGVWDSFLTDERWLLPGQVLTRVSTIPAAAVEAAQRSTRQYHRGTCRNATWRTRLATMLEVADALQPYYPQRCEYFRRTAAEMGVDLLNLSPEHIRMKETVL